MFLPGGTFETKVINLIEYKLFNSSLMALIL